MMFPEMLDSLLRSLRAQQPRSSACPGDLTVGVVGAGEIATKFHLPLLSAADGTHVSWIADADPARSKDAADAYLTRAVELPSSVGELPECDILLLAIPYGARFPYYEAYESTEVAILVEKPLFRTLEEHERVCGLFPDFRFGHSLPKRTFSPTQHVKSVVESRLLGELHSVHFGLAGHNMVTGGSYRARDVQLAGGGLLFEVGFHGLDALLYLVGASGTCVEECEMVFAHGFDIHARAEFTIQRETGGTVAGTALVSQIKSGQNGIVLRFENGIVRYSVYGDSGLVELEDRTGARFAMTRLDAVSGEVIDPFPLTTYQTGLEHWRLFTEGVKSGVANYTSAHTSVATTRLIEQCYQKCTAKNSLN